MIGIELTRICFYISILNKKGMGKLYCKIEHKWCKMLKRGVCTYCNKNITEVSRCPRLADIETIRFSEMLKTVKFDDVFVALVKWFEDQKNAKAAYNDVFDKLLRITPIKHNLTDMFINIRLVKDDEYGDWLDVEGVDIVPKTDKHYGIEFMPWMQWISMFITKETLEQLSPEEIVAACLWEMTFYGFDEPTVIEHENELIEAVEECKNKCA